MRSQGTRHLPVVARARWWRPKRRAAGILRRRTERRADGRDIHYYHATGADPARPGTGQPTPPPADAVLVTGGAGYVAGPLVARLAATACQVVVLDDLSTSSGDTLPPEAVLVRGAVGDRVTLRAVFARYRVRAVFHFAADSRVGESMTTPLMYYRHNVAAPLVLIEEFLAAAGTAPAGPPPFILSSSAAVYGIPDAVPVAEDAPLRPINPYGETKAAFERVLHWAGRAHGLPWAALRYFNAAGADGPWEPKQPETHLIPNVLAAAAGGPPLKIFGNDYPTADGTAVRDYVHVADLAEGHLAALRHLQSGGGSGAFNLGTGHGYSVAEVVSAVEAVTGRPVPREMVGRRAGDPPALIADPRKAQLTLGWRAGRSDLNVIVGDAWQAMRAYATGREAAR